MTIGRRHVPKRPLSRFTGSSQRPRVNRSRAGAFNSRRAAPFPSSIGRQQRRVQSRAQFYLRHDTPSFRQTGGLNIS